MTTLASLRVPSGDPIREAFTDQTHAHLERFQKEMRALHRAEIQETPILLASDILLATQYARASWETFDAEAYFELCLAMGFGAHLADFKVTILAFLSFLERSSVVSSEVVERVRNRSIPPPPPDEYGAYTAPMNHAPLNRAERRWAARMARRRR